MTAMNNTINILKPFLKKLEEVYGDTLHFDDNDGKKYGYVVGTGGVIINVSMRDGSLSILVFEEMSLENTKGYLTYHGLPQTLGGFAYKKPEEVQDIMDRLCGILLETPAANIDAKIVKQKLKEAEDDYYRKHPPISEHTMQRIRSEAERAELNMSLNKG